MAKRSKKPGVPRAGESKDAEERERPFNNPFVDLVLDLPAGTQPAPPVAVPPPQASPGQTASIGGKVVLRLERKGHGGKTATAVTGLVLRGVEPTQLARELGKALGCSARMDGERMLLGGDQRERAAELLRERGVTRVVI